MKEKEIKEVGERRDEGEGKRIKKKARKGPTGVEGE
jgi:hypothetical protein